MKLQVVLSEVSFNSPAHYFIKLNLDSQDSKSLQRTPVSTISSKTPLFAQTTFYFELDPNHPLTTPKALTIKKSVLNLTACLINQETNPPSIIVNGTASVVVFPNEPLQRGILDMQIVYFHNESKSEIGKCIVTISVTKSGEGISEKSRLDPVDSFLNLRPPLITTSTPTNAPDKDITSSSVDNALLLNANLQQVAASRSNHEKMPPFTKINSKYL
jgi:hypothetical protein